MTSLIIIDTNAFLHSIITQFDRHTYLSEQERNQVLEFNAMYMLSGAYLERILKNPHEQIEVVWAMDCTPYWRSPLLSAIGCDYKKKAGSVSHRSLLVEPLREVLSNFLIKTFNIPLFTLYKDLEQDTDKLVAFEADDIAAGLVLRYHDKYNKIYVITDDCDWLPFTSFPNVIWLGVHGREPRIRTNVIALDWLKNTYHEVRKTKERSRFVFNTLTDLWQFKAFFGDISDNIPGDKKSKTSGQYLPFIHLFEPLPGFECWLQEDFDEKFINSKSKPHEITSLDTLREINYGVPLSIYPYGLNEYQT